jgi:hypothetical protein
MSKTIIVRFLLCASPLLAGCSTGQENFSTEPGAGFGWKSMQENHRRIHSELEDATHNKGKVLSLTTTPQPYLGQTGSCEGVERVPEQYVRVWFAPFQDVFGNLHEEGAIHTVIQGGHWHVPSLIKG